MIAVALSGGIDSAAAAILLKENDLPIMGVTMSLGKDYPLKDDVARAAFVCNYLGIKHYILDLTKDFIKIKDYFCKEYISGNTPNPCAICNRDIKFGLLLDKAKTLGAHGIATGHYVKKITSGSRYYLSKSKEEKTQEYFLGLITQTSIKNSIFPLGDITRAQAEDLVKDTKMDLSYGKSSQDVCFVPSNDYVSFITSYTGFSPSSGYILDPGGRILGSHKGALHYTTGQRKGLNYSAGRRVYVLATDMKKNAITVGDKSQWPYNGFFVTDINYMKLEQVKGPIEAKVQVRYRQKPQHATIMPTSTDNLWVEFKDMCAPGQLAVFYDNDDNILCAGIIKKPI